MASGALGCSQAFKSFMFFLHVFPLLNPTVLNPDQDTQPTQISIHFLVFDLEGNAGLVFIGC